jgi:hypothetical protein
MPIWLRKFTYNKIKEFYEASNTKDQNSVVDQNIKTLKSSGNTKDKQPLKKISPATYVTKASKK